MSLTTETYPGFPDGMNVAFEQQAIADTEARYIQDGLVDRPGETRRRGPVRATTSVSAQPTRKGVGLAVTLNPAGSDFKACLNGNASNGYFSVWSAGLTTLTDLAWPFTMTSSPGTGSPYLIVDSKPALNGGSFVGTLSKYTSGASHALALWYGGTKANYAAASFTVTRGSTTVTAPSGFTANVDPGMHLFGATDAGDSGAYFGTVKSVDSDTSLTLINASLYAATAKAGTFQTLRGIAPRAAKGEITCDTTSATVNGGDTKFISQGLNSGTWDIFRASDSKWIGRVSSVATETSLTLQASAAVAMANDDYFAVKATATYSMDVSSQDKIGGITATYAQRQWYIRDTTAAFSDTLSPENVDLSVDGDWIPIDSQSTQVNENIRGAIATYNALLIFKESETWGIFGTTPETFEVKKLEDDGALCGMSIQPFGGGAIWAGRDGIYFYDGVNVRNLLAAKFGNEWRESIRTFDPNTYRMYSFLTQSHYYLWVENLAPTFTPIKGNTAETVTSWGVMINMTTGAPVLLTNVHVRGAITLPASTGHHVWYLVNDNSKGYVCDSADIFDAEGADSVTADGGTAGPDFYIESKKFDAGDGLLLKRFKQLALNYLSQGDALKVDLVIGLNDVGSTLSSTFPATVPTWDMVRAMIADWDAMKAQYATWSDVVQGVFAPKRLRFMKKTQYVSFRVYQASSSITRLKIGPFQIGYRRMRPGRV